jgi:hypothetical protein
VEERLHVNPTVLISVEFQESRGAEEVTELQRQLGGDSKEGVVIETFLVIVGRRNVLLEELMELL